MLDGQKAQRKKISKEIRVLFVNAFADYNALGCNVKPVFTQYNCSNWERRARTGFDWTSDPAGSPQDSASSAIKVQTTWQRIHNKIGSYFVAAINIEAEVHYFDEVNSHTSILWMSLIKFSLLHGSLQCTQPFSHGAVCLSQSQQWGPCNRDPWNGPTPLKLTF